MYIKRSHLHLLCSYWEWTKSPTFLKYSVSSLATKSQGWGKHIPSPGVAARKIGPESFTGGSRSSTWQKLPTGLLKRVTPDGPIIPPLLLKDFPERQNQHQNKNLHASNLVSGESHSVVSNSLQPHGLYSPWNSPGQKTGVGSLSVLQGIFPTQGSNPGLLHCRWILYQLSHREAQEYWNG